MAVATVLQQSPTRNATTIGAQVCSHSGEFSPWVVDFLLPGRGVSFDFTRTYRSGNHEKVGGLGRGWTFTYEQRMTREGNDYVYEDGFGRTYRFVKRPGKKEYISPDGFYSVLLTTPRGTLLRQRHGFTLTFEASEIGGRLALVADRYNNTLAFEYSPTAVIITDPFGRQIALAYAKNRLASVRDHSNRIWQYSYNSDDCLVEVVQPSTQAYPAGPRIKYAYDASHRLSTITDPNGNTFLRTSYDDEGRVARQEHGAGAFEFSYESMGWHAGFPINRTHLRLKNEERVLLEHDADGHVIQHTCFVTAASLGLADLTPAANGVPLATTSVFNRHGELSRRVYPAGHATNWHYDESQADARARGNLLQTTNTPAPECESDQTVIVTSFTYESKYQQCRSITDPRGYTTRFQYDSLGNMIGKVYPEVTVHRGTAAQNRRHATQVRQLREHYAYNSSGQLVQIIDPRGAVTQFFYYPADDPSGSLLLGTDDARPGERGRGEPPPARRDGYLAKIVRDAARPSARLKIKPALLSTAFAYDARGNVTTIWDGNGNPTHLQYDAHSRLIRLQSRPPFNDELTVDYDANGNPIQFTTSFVNNAYVRDSGHVMRRTSTISRRHEYNVLNNIVRSTLTGDEAHITEVYIRDASENIIRTVDPMGNKCEYEFDARGLPVLARAGVGTDKEVATRYTYTRSGLVSSVLDARGHKSSHQYDGFQRYCGLTNACGTTKRQSFDAASNVVRVIVTGDPGAMVNEATGVSASRPVLLDVTYQYDELNRPVRTTRPWRDVISDQPLGQSQWSGQVGVVDSVVEYADNHSPAKIYFESGIVRALAYDGANRIITVRDGLGESVAANYDANSNPISVERFGPGRTGRRFHQFIRQDFDTLDRIVRRSVNDNAPERFSYNALGLVTTYTDRAGSQTHNLHDTIGRSVGRATLIAPMDGAETGGRQHLLLERVERDDNGCLVARVNAAGARTTYEYDGLNRCVAVTFPDGTSTRYSYDENGNAVRVIDPNSVEVVQSFDDADRLTQRYVEDPSGGRRLVETYQYDGLNRIVRTTAGDIATGHRYDSLSRLVAETQGDRVILHRYDAAGNCTLLTYPGGDEARRSYDSLGRLTAVRDSRDGLITQYMYRSGEQLRRQTIGRTLRANFGYQSPENWLNEIFYRSAETGEVISGSRYLHDRRGNRVVAMRAQMGRLAGEAYIYDSAARLIEVQHGIERPGHSNDGFAGTITYTLDGVGAWREKTTVDAAGRIVTREEGVTNARGGYQSFGPRVFEYDASGNRVLERVRGETGAGGNRYSYDYANKLQNVQCMNADGIVTQSVAYDYDAFGRQVRKRITAMNEIREYERVWNGNQLIEEWEQGRLARSFVYGARAEEPVQMTRYLPRGTEKLFYTFDGRSFVTALVGEDGKVVERYDYDAFRQPYLSEVGGHAAAPGASSSTVGNPLRIGSHIWDADVALHFDRGNAFDPGTGHWNTPGSWPGRGPFGGDYTGGDNPISMPGLGPDYGTGFGGALGPDYGTGFGEDFGFGRGGCNFNHHLTPGDWSRPWALPGAYDGGVFDIATGFWAAIGVVGAGAGVVAALAKRGMGLGLAWVNFIHSAATFGAWLDNPYTVQPGASTGGKWGPPSGSTTGRSPGAGSSSAGSSASSSGATGRTSVAGAGGRPDTGSGSHDSGDHNSGANASGNGGTGSSGSSAPPASSSGSTQPSTAGSAQPSGSSSTGSTTTSGGGGGTGTTPSGGGKKTDDPPPKCPPGTPICISFTPNPMSDDQPNRPKPGADPVAYGAGDTGIYVDPQPPRPGVDPFALGGHRESRFGIGAVATIGGPGMGGPGDVGIYSTVAGPGTVGPGDVGIYSTLAGPGTVGPGDVGRLSGPAPSKS
jgi:YD repeat-containing protein